MSASAKKVVTVSIVLDIEGSEADALHVIDRLLDNGFAQDPINEHEVEGADALHVAAAVVRLGAPPVVKPADRHKGSVQEHVRVQVRGESTLVTVIGPGDAKDDVSMWSDGAGVSTSLRLPRDAARRLGELLVQAADDVPVAPAPAAEGGAA